MGKALSTIKHPFRNFNLESRAHKVISQPKPKPAPKHLKDELDIQRIKREYPEVFKESVKKHDQLDKNLKDVYVVSHDKPIEVKQEVNPQRPLPQDRSQAEPFLFGHKEPEPKKIPVGKTTLRNALKFISQHQSEPIIYTPAKIAEEHKLPEDVVKSILKFYRVFEIYIPDQSTNTKAKFAGPSMPKVYVIKDSRKQLPAPEIQKDKDQT